jgi:hypothetical protein
MLGAETGQNGSDEAPRVLAAAKEASGGANWDTIITWFESGTVTKAGVEGTFQRSLNFVGSRNAAIFDFADSCQCTGWNGNLSWSIGPRGVQDLANKAAAVTEAYWRTFAYWRSGVPPAQQVYVGSRQLGDRTCDVVKITPNGGEPFELWLDRDTHLVIREVDLTGSRARIRDFSDFRSGSGVIVPATIHETAGDPQQEQITKIAALRINVVLPANQFDPPVYMAAGDVFPRGKNSVVVAFSFSNNHIFVPVRLNGGNAKQFIFDTGAFNAVSKQEAAFDGITSEGNFQAGGVGENSIQFSYATIGAVNLGRTVLRNQLFTIFDLSLGDRFEDLPVLGLIGYEMAEQAVITIDYVKHQLTVIKPSRFRPPPNTRAVPIKFRGHIPVVEAVLDGVPGEFQLDTGARPSLTLTRWFADQHGLVEKYQARREVIGGYGLGGPSHGLLAQPEEFVLGGFRVKAPVAVITSDWRSKKAMSKIAGDIGDGLLKRFTVTLDYPHGMLYLEPNRHFKEPDVFDRSGLSLMRSGGNSAFEIFHIVEDSPAAKAGLKVGEKILSVGKVAASTLTMESVRERLKKKPGTRIHLEVEGENETRGAVLVLEDLY